ncbi:MAG TPA: hypothetical protein VEI02_01125 [Planctomycetota bacterium]|nr:hypothetical protein [Planctomycetota bacterium]
MPASLPQLNALILCDSAFQQAVTGKWCVIGTFSAIWVRDLPATHAPLVTFVSLSDFGGGALVQISVRDPEGEHVVSVRAQIPPLPAPQFEFAFVFPPVTFKTAGVYTLELFSGGELLGVRSLRVEKLDPTKMPFAFFGPGGPTPPGVAPPSPFDPNLPGDAPPPN